MNLSEHITQVEKEMKGVLTEVVDSPFVEKNIKDIEHEIGHKLGKADKDDEADTRMDALDQEMSEMSGSPYSSVKETNNDSQGFLVDDEVDEATLHMPSGDTGGIDGMRDMISMFDLDDVKGGGEFSFDADRDGDADVKMAFGDLENDDEWAYKGMGEDVADEFVDDEEASDWTDSTNSGLTVSFGDDQGISTMQPMADEDTETDLDWSKIGAAFKGMSRYF
jgi:hypothetical protein